MAFKPQQQTHIIISIGGGKVKEHSIIIIKCIYNMQRTTAETKRVDHHICSYSNAHAYQLCAHTYTKNHMGNDQNKDPISEIMTQEMHMVILPCFTYTHNKNFKI